MQCTNCQCGKSKNDNKPGWRRWIPSPCTLLWIVFIILLANEAWGQDTDRFKQAVEHYKNEEYREAAELFVQLDRPEAHLFAGKSYFAMGRFLEAQAQLRALGHAVPADIRNETLYTGALVDFHLKQYGSALNRLDDLLSQQSVRGSSLEREARNYYNQFVKYLTLNQRRAAFYQTEDEQVRFDLVHSAFGHVDYSTARALYDIYKTSLRDTSTATLQLQQLRSQLADSVNYAIRQRNRERNPQAPEGTIYNLGVALPSFSPDTPEYEVAQSLFNGFRMAAESFNRRNSDRKAFIRFKATDPANQQMEHVLNTLTWNNRIDALLGPLFSETAHSMSDMAEQYQIPMVAPLANSDTLNLNNPYLFQMNPTFRVRGQQMANYAVNELGLDTLAVIAQRKGWGTEAAFAFRTQAERLGAKVQYFFLRNFEQNGYDLTTIAEHFSGNKKLLDSLNYKPVDAVYAPFTGQGAPTLIDLLLTDLEASNSNITILGSEEWNNVPMSEERKQRFDIYFTQGYSPNPQHEAVQRFNEEYRARFGLRATPYAYIGYDTADFVLRALEKVNNPALLKDGLRNLDNYQGLTGSVNFGGGHVNMNAQVKRLEAASDTTTGQ